MSITKEEVRHIAHLARLELSDNQAEKTKHDFDELLGYFEQLNEVDVEGVEPMRGATDTMNRFRDDEVVRSSGKDVREKFISIAPEHTDEYIETISPFK